MTDDERLAIERVKKAGVRADDKTLLDFVRSVSPKTILSTSLGDILAVANAF